MRSTLLISVVCLSLAALAGCKKPGGDRTSGEPEPTGSTASPATAFAGGYTITAASNPGGGGRYAGSVSIAQAAGYQTIDWTIANSPPYAGVGITAGDKLGVGWGVGGNYGVAVYKITGGKLTGTWTSKGLTGVGAEEIEGPASLDGTFTISKSRTPDGKSYTGTVTIEPTGDTYAVTWATTAGSYSGVGIKDGDLFVAGWGKGGQGAGVVLYTKTATGMDGIWATPGGRTLGTETLGK